METKFTKGTWSIQDAGPKSGNVIRIEIMADGWPVCEIEDSEIEGSPHDEAANAALIAASPTMFDALAECVTDPGAMAWDDPEAAYRRLRAINDIARAALAKARGE